MHSVEPWFGNGPLALAFAPAPAGAATSGESSAPGPSGASIPAGVARDWPRYPERGLMIDAFVSLGVVVSALLVALDAETADPLVGIAISLVILKITWDSWRLVSNDGPH